MNHICFICDDNYKIPTIVAINSLKRNINRSGGLQYVCHIVSFGLSDDSIKAFSALGENGFDVQIKIVDDKNFKERLNQVHQRTHVTQSALLKFELPNLFSNYDKVLYLDSDVLIRSDISDVFSIDISNSYMAASTEYWGRYNELRYHFSHRNGENWEFNAGFMLFNIQKMLKDGVIAKLWQAKMSSQSFLMDQACLNTVIGQDYYHLSIRYNFNPMFSGPFNVPYINEVYNTDYSSMEDVMDDAAVIHYVSHEAKPWVYKDVAFGELWLNEYEKALGSREQLGLKQASRMKKPEFCMGIRKILKSKGGFFKLVSYAILIIKNWNYYKTVIF